MARLASILATALALSSALTAADVPEADPTLARIKKDIYFLAGDECEGRGTETKGILKAGQYVADAFKESGLKPAGTEGYFQPFSIAGPPRLGSPNTLGVAAAGENAALKFGTDFTPLAASATGKFDGKLVFVGYGISAPKLNYDDYAGVDVAGKVVVVLRRTPRAEQKDSLFEKESGLTYAALVSKLATAAAKKAAGVIFVNDATYGKNGDPLMDFRSVTLPTTMPVLHVKRPVLERLLVGSKRKLADIEAQIDKELKPQSFDLEGAGVTGEATVEKTGLPARNVVAVSPGAGPLAEETVVIGAHYDHLGYGEAGSLLGPAGKGKLHYGADDNGSGTTGLIELSRRVGAMQNRQGRRIVFIAFAGEERGLFGSIHYCKEPAFPLTSTVFMINMDMIGRVVAVDDVPTPKDAPKEPAKAATPAVKKDRVVVYGTGTAEGLDAVVEASNARIGFKMIKLGGGTGPSDHDSFYRKKIPVLFFFTGTHKDYHRPTDTPDKINLAGLAKVVGFAEMCLLHYATTPERPKYLVTKGGWEDPTEERPARPARGMPKLGIMPGNYESTEGGVLVEGLTPGGAAEKGGLKEKDVVIEIAGKPVADINAYMAAMAAQKPGVKIEVVVLREGKKVTLPVVPQP